MIAILLMNILIMSTTKNAVNCKITKLLRDQTASRFRRPYPDSVWEDALLESTSTAYKREITCRKLPVKVAPRKPL